MYWIVPTYTDIDCAVTVGTVWKLVVWYVTVVAVVPATIMVFWTGITGTTRITISMMIPKTIHLVLPLPRAPVLVAATGWAVEAVPFRGFAQWGQNSRSPDGSSLPQLGQNSAKLISLKDRDAGEYYYFDRMPCMNLVYVKDLYGGI